MPEQKDYTDYFKGRDWVHQIGFYAPDWKEFMQCHHDLFGSGPFFYTTNKFGKLLHYGEEVDCSNLEFHACYGGWGSHSIEVVQPDPFDVPTMYTVGNEEGVKGFNHLHMFVDDLEEALEACDYLDIPVVTVGYSDLETSLAKARQLNMTDEQIEQIKEGCKHPSFMVVDMRDDFGCMVQLITPRAKFQHDMIIKAAEEWDGDEATLFRPFGI